MSTLQQLLKLNDRTLIEIAGLSQVFDDAPVLARLPGGISSNGNVHQFNREITPPSSSFRLPGGGASNTNSVEELVTIVLSIFDASWRKDQAVIDAYFSQNPDDKNNCKSRCRTRRI